MNNLHNLPCDCDEHTKTKDWVQWTNFQNMMDDDLQSFQATLIATHGATGNKDAIAIASAIQTLRESIQTIRSLGKKE